MVPTSAASSWSMISGGDPARGVGILGAVAAELALDLVVRPPATLPPPQLYPPVLRPLGDSGRPCCAVRDVSMLSVALALRSRRRNRLSAAMLAVSESRPTRSVLSVLLARTRVPSARAMPMSAYETLLTERCWRAVRIRSCSLRSSSISDVARAVDSCV
ncbi:hypothetical protein VTI28DRAFT_787 [Corynascus sepedonium]